MNFILSIELTGTIPDLTILGIKDLHRFSAHW